MVKIFPPEVEQKFTKIRKNLNPMGCCDIISVTSKGTELIFKTWEGGGSSHPKVYFWIIPGVVTPPRMPVANEGLVRDALLEI